LILAILWAFLVPLEAWCSEIAPEQIERILGYSTLQKAAPQGTLTGEMLDEIATAATRQLGQGNSMWNKSAPEWRAVFNRVRADIEKDKPAVASAFWGESSARASLHTRDIASEMQEADVSQILSYAESPQGKRYTAFLGSMDVIMASGILAVAQHMDIASSTVKVNRLSPEQRKQYLRLIQLSRIFQSTRAMTQMNANDDGVVLHLFVLATIAKNAEGLDSLYRTYADDLPGFEAFSKTEPCQHLFRAMAIADRNLSKRTMVSPFSAPVTLEMEKHGAEWKALYAEKTAK
jgi:hypothetical protein